MPPLTRSALRGALAAAGVAAVTVAGPADAAQTATSVLSCGSTSYTVDGFGRGQVLHVTGSRVNFIVTRAVREGDVVFDSPAKADRSEITCTTRTPGPDGVRFTFTGFFTPAA